MPDAPTTPATDEEVAELARLASEGAFEPGRNGNYGYAHDPADESRDSARREEARIRVCERLPRLIARIEAEKARAEGLTTLLADARDNGLIYWEPNTP